MSLYTSSIAFDTASSMCVMLLQHVSFGLSSCVLHCCSDALGSARARQWAIWRKPWAARMPGGRKRLAVRVGVGFTALYLWGESGVQRPIQVTLYIRRCTVLQQNLHLICNLLQCVQACIYVCANDRTVHMRGNMFMSI